MQGKILRYSSLEDIPFVWDDSRLGVCWQDVRGLWHFSRTCSLQVILFHLNLTDADKRFLKSLKIGIDY